MLRSRIIPCLLVHNKGLVKTVKFKNPKYVGDPINAVKIFNEKEVDELILYDIDSSVLNKDPNFDLIKKIARECKMPLCYGGGIKNLDQAKKIINLGAEKISVSSLAIENIDLCYKITELIGSQSLVITLDVKKSFWGNYNIYTLNGTKKSKYNLNEFIDIINQSKIGELVINSIDNDGLMNGYDFNLISLIYNKMNIPITILGGAGSLDHVKKLYKKYEIIGAAAGSLFVFNGKFNAVLINYPSYKEKNKLFN